MSHINPQKLKAVREAQSLSQDQLAEASGVSKKQISRLEQGTKLNKCHSTTFLRLAAALRVSEAEDLTKPPEADQEAQLAALGVKRAYVYMTDQDRLHYRFLEDRYGVQAQSILRAAPLLFLIAAEISLAERKKSLSAFENALGEVPEHNLEHLRDVRIGIYRAEEAASAERQSIEARDLSGRTFSHDEWKDEPGDLFVDFLERKIRELYPAAIMGDLGEVSGKFASLQVSLFGDEIDKLSAGDRAAELALTSGDVHPKDIPKKLLGEDQMEARAKWLAERCSEKTLKAHKKRMAELPDLGPSTLDSDGRG